MVTGNFYFLKDQYFIDFPDDNLMKNKEYIQGELHRRPCFYSFCDNNTNIYWMIPFSSKVDKYKSIYNKKVSRYGICDTIAFGKVLGHEKAFLIQNMCPVIPYYIDDLYIDSKASVPVRVDGAFEKDLISKATKVLTLHKNGIRLIFPDVLNIEKSLIEMLKSTEKVNPITE